MGKYKVTIGLEVHAELKTHTKMFCNSRNDPDEKHPNVNICPICMGHPGTLPVINQQAVFHVLRIGEAVGGTLADFTEFDRKNYFYPDIPKAYQITQYKYPLVSGGSIAGIELTRIHLEEDTASSRHDRGDYSLVDFNRAGVPLMELVTEPVIHDAETAMRFAKELQLLLRYLGAGDANMEKGEMRVEANISISQTEKFGTKVEVKNINSFRNVSDAIAYEISRQTDVLERGEKVIQETRGWDDAKQKTFSQRKKESANDYRYFPDPDLPKLKISELASYELLKQSLPELPWEKRARYLAMGLSEAIAEIFVTNGALSTLFDAVASGATSVDPEVVKLAVNYLTTDVVSLMKSGKTDEVGLLTAESFVELLKMVKSGDLSSRGVKDVLPILFHEGGNPSDIAKEKGLIQKSDSSSLEVVVRSVILQHHLVAEEFRNGKQSVLQFLVGQGMKETRGSGNPQVLAELFTRILTE